MSNWLWNVLVAIDQGLNALLGPLLNWALEPAYPFGYPDETLSSVFGKNTDACRVCRLICRWLHRADPDHCERSIESDEGKAKQP